MIRDGEGTNERCYQFSQESLDLVHSLDIRHHLANNSDSVSIGYPLTNDSEDCKFKQTGLAAGRSPFSMVSLSLSGIYDKRLKFEYLTTKEKEKLGEYYQMNPRMAWDRMMVDWKQKGWISQSGELLKTWSEMKEKLEKRKYLVGLDQWRDTMTFLESGLWMDILYRQMSITGEDISHLTVEFVGSACYVTSDFLKVQGHHLACYEPYCVG